jgi:hypothetical protein
MKLSSMLCASILVLAASAWTEVRADTPTKPGDGEVRQTPLGKKAPCRPTRTHRCGHKAPHIAPRVGDPYDTQTNQPAR